MKCISKRSLNRLANKNGGYGVSVYLGCSLEKFISRIEFQFYDGMNWENYGHYSHDSSFIL